LFADLVPDLEDIHVVQHFEIRFLLAPASLLRPRLQARRAGSSRLQQIRDDERVRLLQTSRELIELSPSAFTVTQL
jgi:hypothetical protein